MILWSFTYIYNNDCAEKNPKKGKRYMSAKLKDVTNSRFIKANTTQELWAKSAGRCQFEGHNVILYKSSVTQEPVNAGQRAHIYSFAEKGPRGHALLEFLNGKVGLNDVDNLILVCYECHRKIDTNPNKYSAELVKKWKIEHEKRIRDVTGVSPDKKSHVVFYCSNISEQKSYFDKHIAIQTIFPERYPSDSNPIVLSMDCSHEDNTINFWKTEQSHIIKEFQSKINRILEDESTCHFSVFSLAPMPLLIQLGSLFTDKLDVDVYQPIREPKGWSWQDFPSGFEFIVNKPTSYKGKPVLAISLSAKIDYQKVKNVLGDDISIWEISVSDEHLHNDNIRNKEQLTMFRRALRKLLVEIKDNHKTDHHLAVFPAMAVSCSVEMGRLRMPKADIPWDIFDYNNKNGGFLKTITIGEFK